MRKILPLVAATVLAAVLVVPATYAILRAYDVLVRPPEANPATIVWSAHIAMFWRLNVGAFVAGIVAPGAYFAASRDLARTMRMLNVCVLAAAAMIMVQGLFMP
jgi:hypothetical protein